jgi:hypothetical protein
LIDWWRMEPEERFARIEATLDRTAEDHRRATADFDKRLKAQSDEMDKRHRIFLDELARADEKWNRRHEAAMARLDRDEVRHREDHRRVDEQIEKGMKLIAKNAADMRVFRAEVRAFIKALGNGHRGSNGRN